MPEGHTIHRAARRIASVLVGRQLERVEARGAQLVEAQARARLLGATITAVEARGKHLLIHTDAGWTLHSHLRMDGVWHLYRRGEPWRRARTRAWLLLGSGDWDAVEFDGPILTLVRTEQLDADQSLTELGPDILVTPFDDDEFLRRMRRGDDREIGDALLQQRIVAGIGNIYKSETLFMTQVDPWKCVREFDDEELVRVRELATRIMEAGVLDARAITFHGPGPKGRWVYRRAGMPCRRCATAIRSALQGDDQRTTYWCPRCQS
jgi:endonuclease-8